MTHHEKCSEARENLYCLIRVLDGRISETISDAARAAVLTNIAVLAPEPCTGAGVGDDVAGD